MKENILRAFISVTLAAFALYLQALLIPIAILIAFMIIDYATGLASAWMTKTLSSREGVIGIIKKVCYLVVVLVGMGVDYIVSLAAGLFGYDLSKFFTIALIVVIWLILNEFISILENLNEMSVPLPGFLCKIIDKLKKTTEAQLEGKTDA